MKNNTLLRNVRWLALMSLIVLAALALIATSPGTGNQEVIGGLVYIDANHNGIWDAGEEGYGGQYGVAKENGDWVWRYRGTNATFTPVGSGPEDPIVTESLPFREMEDLEENGDICTRQDLGRLEDDPHYVPHRPCQGTFGMLSWNDDITWDVSIEVPDGYELTSDPVLHFTTGEQVPLCDFGIAPVASQ